MAQICRMNKFEVPVLIRILSSNCTCHKRCQSNYYDVLRIPRNATQKEIKEAFIKLSKEMHPDCGNKGNHSDFIKLNEAYTVLSKKNSRHYYDIGVKFYNDPTHHNCDFQSNKFYGYHDLHEVRNETYSTMDKAKILGFCVILMIFGSIIQLVRVKMWSDMNRRAAFERHLKSELIYQNCKKEREEFLKSHQFELNIRDK